MTKYEDDVNRREDEWSKSQARANGYTKDQVTWKYILGIAAAILLLCFGAMGWFINKGYDNLMEGNKRIELTQEKSVTAFQRRCDEGEVRDKMLATDHHKLDKRVSGLEIWVTMPYDQRVKALEKLGGMGKP